MQVLKFLVLGGKNSKFARQCWDRGLQQQSGFASKCSGAGAELRLPVEAYNRIIKTIRAKAHELQVLTRDASRGMLESIKNADAATARANDLQMRGEFAKIERKIKEIGSMSLVCGHEKRTEGYALAEKIASELQVWVCGNMAGRHCVECRLADLESRVCERTRTAVEAVKTCRGCLSGPALARCLVEASSAATKILDASERECMRELSDLTRLRARLGAEKAQARNDTICSLLAELGSFDKHLDDCIAALKAQQR